jgi:MerR family transcriptional regulator, light-induced transcriptional regulator
VRNEKQHQDGIPSPGTVARPLSIGALSRATGIPAETLRTWERRYGSPRPTRKPSGHRLYPAAFVERLRRVARLLAQGHRPADVLNLTLSQLDSLLSLNEPAAKGPPTAFQEGDVRRFQDTLLHASIRFDRDSLMRELRAAWGRLGPLRFLEDVSGPFMIRVGLDWAEGRMEIRHEHFASGCLSDFLREVREPFEQEAKGPRIAAALLPGDAHEGGLLMACALLAVRGCRVVYLGADTPIDQIAATATSGGAEGIVVSVSAGVPRTRAEREIRRLREGLPRRVPLWVGGGGAPDVPSGAERFRNLTEFAARLESRI